MRASLLTAIARTKPSKRSISGKIASTAIVALAKYAQLLSVRFEDAIKSVSQLKLTRLNSRSDSRHLRAAAASVASAIPNAVVDDSRVSPLKTSEYNFISWAFNGLFAQSKTPTADQRRAAR
jgi:hypothetical protein